LRNEKRYRLKGRGDRVGQSRSTVQSVERAIAILNAFSPERPERGIGELSRELDLHKSTVSRLMKTLERGGLLARHPETERYRLGVGLIGLAEQVVSHLDLREVARPFLRRLAETCQETVNLAVLNGDRVVNLEQFVPPARQVKNIGRVGRRTCLHCTAAGKVLLAHLSRQERDQILPESLERFTPHTITHRHKLEEELTQTHAQGYAVAREELEKGLNVVAAPIYDYSGQVSAAVSVAGPSYRLPGDLLPQLAALVVDTARRISEQLGHEQR
jgi:DNA-binding IclR family transcriptional regulator